MYSYEVYRIFAQQVSQLQTRLPWAALIILFLGTKGSFLLLRHVVKVNT